MNYGIANKTGKPDEEIAYSIVKSAWDGGIRYFDTAAVYGDSESILGRCFKLLGVSDRTRVISKFHPQVDLTDPISVEEAVEVSLDRLGVPKLYCLMLHREELLGSWDVGVRDVLSGLLERGMIEKLGVSVYSTDAAHRALQIRQIGCVQIPANIIDRRFENADVFNAAKRSKKTLFIRSIYLQGLLLKKSFELNPLMQFAIPCLESLHKFGQDHGIPVKTLALVYARLAYPDAKIIFGAETAEQVSENLKLWNTDVPTEVVNDAKMQLCFNDEVLLNPSLWPNEAVH